MEQVQFNYLTQNNVPSRTRKPLNASEEKANCLSVQSTRVFDFSDSAFNGFFSSLFISPLFLVPSSLVLSF